MANISEDLADIAISRSLVLQRYANGLSKQVAEHYTAMIDDIQTTILKSGNISNRLRQTIKDIKEQLSVPNFDKDLKELAQQEVNYTQKAYNSVIGIDLFKNIPPEGAMSAILNTSLIEGATIGAWLKDLENSQAFDVERAIKLGMTLGETNAQLANRLKSTMELSMRNAQTIVRTATATVANQARTEFFNANDEVIKAWKWDATLDGRTRKEHADRDGATWNLDKDGINAKGKKYPFRYTPYGWNCRCQIVPVLKSWQELGIDEEEVPVGTRSSLDGYVSQDMTFDKWLKTKSSEFQKEYLGAGRYELYSKGKITLSDLINQKGRYLSINELKAMSGDDITKKEIFSKKSLNNDEKILIKDKWCNSEYSKIRKSYYDGTENTNKTQLNNLFKKYDGDYDGEIYRGISFLKKNEDRVAMFEKFNNLNVGDSFADNAPMSFSKDPNVAKKFGELADNDMSSVIIRLRNYKTKSYDISSVSWNDWEQEILVKDGIKYKVAEKKYDKNRNILLTLDEE